MRFTKMQGLGNDFMVIDGVSQTIALTPEILRQWGDRRFGVGFDQLLLVEKSTLALTSVIASSIATAARSSNAAMARAALPVSCTTRA